MKAKVTFLPQIYTLNIGICLLTLGSLLYSCSSSENDLIPEENSNSEVVSTEETNTEETVNEGIVEDDTTENQEPVEEIEPEGLVVNEADFFSRPTTFSSTINFRDQFSVDNSFATDDTQKLQQAINQMSNNGGGRIYIPQGNYSFSGVELKPNVHIEVEAGTVFKPVQVSGTRALLMFLFTSQNANEPLRGASLYGINGRFTVDLRDLLPKERGFRFCNFRNADGFYVSNIDVIDDHTVFSAFVFNGETINNRAYGPINGVVKNVSTTNSDFGFGLVQMQLGKNIFFTNLDGDGGTTLRMESHNKNLRTLDAVNVLDNVVGRGVRSTEGNAAVMLSPHFIQNGVVDVRDITAIHSSYAVRIESGFLNQEERDFGLTEVGTFNSNSIIRDVKATYSPTLAQHRSDFVRFLPCNLRSNITTNAANDIFGPSIAAVTFRANYEVNFNENHVTQFNGFTADQPKVVTERVNCN